MVGIEQVFKFSVINYNLQKKLSTKYCISDDGENWEYILLKHKFLSEEIEHMLHFWQRVSFRNVEYAKISD